MNYNISLLITHSFHEFYRIYYSVKLYPVTSQTGECVNNTNNKTYECLCKPKYIVMVSEFLNQETSKVIEESRQNRQIDIINETQFIAFTFMLKFYPITAPLYLAFLLEKNHVPSADMKRFQTEVMNLDIETQVLIEETEGVCEYKGNFIEREIELYQIIMEKLKSTNYCNLRTVAGKYLYDTDLAVCSVISVIAVCGAGFVVIAKLATRH